MPYSCSAWIHSIHRGIDVARAAGLAHIAGATGASSEAAVAEALRPAGDRADRHGRLRRRHAQICPRTHPVPRVTIAGGVAKMTKLAQGLHRSAFQARRGRSCAAWREFARAAGGSAGACARASRRPTTRRKLLRWRSAEGIALGDEVARAAQRTAERVVAGRDIADRDRRCSTATQMLVGRAPF